MPGGEPGAGAAGAGDRAGARGRGPHDGGEELRHGAADAAGLGARYNAEGVAGLADRPRPGRPPRLAPAQLDELIEVVEAGPDVEVDGVVRWRCVDLKEVIADRFTVELSERSVGRLLNGRGYVRLKPRPQHRKADPAAQATFKKTSPRR